MRLLLGWLILIPLGAQTPSEPPGAFIELRIERETVYRGESVVLTLRFGLEAEEYEARGVPLFRRDHELGVQVRAPWLRSLPSTLESVTPRVSAGEPRSTLTMVAEDRAAEVYEEAAEERGGRRYRVFSLTRTVVPSAEGDVELAAPVLRFAWATRFRDDLLGGRVPLDRREQTVVGGPRRLRIETLPPPSGPTSEPAPIGNFRVQVALDRAESRVHEPLRLTLKIAGRGNLDRIGAPDLPELASWPRRGVSVTRGEDEVAFHYDLVVPENARDEIPSLRWDYFDPDPPAQWRTVRTQALPITIVGGRGGDPGAPGLEAGEGEELLPVEPSVVRPAAARGRPPALQLAALLLAPWLVALWIGMRFREGDLERRFPGRRRARRARRRFAPDAAARGPGPALRTYLASRLRTSEAAVLAPDFRARLESRGLSASLAAEVDRAVRRSVEAEFGGVESGPSRHEAAELVERFDRAWAEKEHAW